MGKKKGNFLPLSRDNWFRTVFSRQGQRCGLKKKEILHSQELYKEGRWHFPFPFIKWESFNYFKTDKQSQQEGLTPFKKNNLIVELSDM